MEDTTTPQTESDETEESCMRSEALAPTNLNRALIAARKAVAARVFKAQYNKHQDYAYVSHEAVLQHARDALLDNGLVLEQRSVMFDGVEQTTTANRTSTVWRWCGIFALVHDAGEERLYTFSATTQPNDKAAYVASTSLDKVAHMRVLQLAGTSDENAEADYHDNQPGGAAYRTPTLETRQPPPRQPREPSNVLRLPQPQRAVDGPPEYASVLEMVRGKMARQRSPEQLIGWWVDLVTKLPTDAHPGFVPEAWRMFQQHAAECVGRGASLKTLNAQIAARVKAARDAQEGA